MTYRRFITEAERIIRRKVEKTKRENRKIGWMWHYLGNYGDDAKTIIGHWYWTGRRWYLAGPYPSVKLKECGYCGKRGNPARTIYRLNFCGRFHYAKRRHRRADDMLVETLSWHEASDPKNNLESCVACSNIMRAAFKRYDECEQILAQLMEETRDVQHVQTHSKRYARSPQAHAPEPT